MHRNEVPGSIQRRLDAFQRFASLARRAFLWGNCEGECQSVLTSMFYNTLPFMISTSFAALPAPASNCTSYSSAGLSRLRSQASSPCCRRQCRIPAKPLPEAAGRAEGRGSLVLLGFCFWLAPVALGSFSVPWFLQLNKRLYHQTCNSQLELQWLFSCSG